MCITQEMHCSYPALLNNCAVHNFFEKSLAFSNMHDNVAY